MARDQIGSSADSIGLFPTIHNNNVVKDDALQAATGLAEGVENIGSVPGTLPSGAPNASDTLLALAYKAYSAGDNAIGTDDTRHSGANNGRDRALVDDYDYRAATTAVLGTTEITSTAQATALGYPSAGLWQVETRYSAATGGASAGRLQAAILSNGTKAYVTLADNGTWTTPADALAMPYRVEIDATTDWGSASSGTYTYTLTAATHGQGADIDVLAYDLSEVSGSRIPYFGYRIEAATGDITFTAQEDPDTRTALRIVVRKH